MNVWLDRGRRRPALLLLIALAHLGAVWLLERQIMHWPHKRLLASSVELQLLPAPLRRAAAPTQVVKPIWQRPPVGDVFDIKEPTLADQPTQAEVAVVASQPPASAAAAPLRLNLPLNMLAQPTLQDMIHNDPRSHSLRVTLENRIADAAGTLPIVTEAATDGTDSRLIRQGSKCTRVTQARVATLNPMDERARSQPAVSGNCFH